MSDENEDRSLAQWAAEGVEPEPAPVVPKAPEPVAEAVPEPEASEAAPEPAEAADGEHEPVAEPAVAESPKPAKGKIKPLEPWVKERLGEMTAKQRDAERRAAEAEARANVAIAESEALRKRIQAAPAPEGKESEPSAVVPLNRQSDPSLVPASEVEARAQRLATEREMNARADQAYYAGKAQYSDFDDAIAPLQEMGAFANKGFYDALFASGAEPDVLYHLGSNPNEASKIVGLIKSGNVTKATAEMTKIATAIEAKKAAPKPAPKTSQAPAPIKPVGGSALPSVDLDKADDETFTAEFEKKAKTNGWW
jgi:hypothetical protein